MGVQAKSLTGASVKLYIENPKSGTVNLAGIFSSASYGVNYGLEPVYVLGRYNAAEIAYTSMDTITITCNGFRVADDGPYANTASVPQLQDLLTHQDHSLSLVDRKTNEVIMVVTGCRPQSWSSNSSSRALQDLSVTFVGTVFSDESGDQQDPGATDFG